MTNDGMTMVEAARALADAGQAEQALAAYTAALGQDAISDEERFETACAVLQYGEDYKIAYDAFLALYRDSTLRGDAFSILTEAFYAPNVKKQEKLYKKNCRLLSAYPYLFRKDFLPFAELPVQFYPYDDNGVLPFHRKEERFDEYLNVNDPVISHYFFKDLSKPILAHDIVSQYELEYLKDNVRRSDWVGYENHIYLHYSDWGTFCAYLAVLDMKPLLEDEKIVFLIEGEETLYPIDFKERFGIDYSQYPVKPIGIREINKLIWHTQLGTHNGGDFFNEVLHEHPNIIDTSSVMFYDMKDAVKVFYDTARDIIASNGAMEWSPKTRERFESSVLQQLISLKNVTQKDALLAFFLGMKEEFPEYLCPNARIVPALMIQPHFHYLKNIWSYRDGKIAVLDTNYRELVDSGILQQFKYIKTFTPLRRPTTSHGATMRFMDIQNPDDHEFYDHVSKKLNAAVVIPTISDNLSDIMLNRSMMITDCDRLYRDSRLVRFEDAKLNPTATFTALAEFLDVPYAQSMTYCSDSDGRDPGGIGFSTASVYRTYDAYVDHYERTLIEYTLRDIYSAYGYDFHDYDGKDMTQQDVEELLEKCTANLEYIEKSNWECKERIGKVYKVKPEELDNYVTERIKGLLEQARELRLLTVRILSYGLHFCTPEGEPLHLMTPLTLDPALLEQPLYH